MSLLDADLQKIFGAAFGALYRDATLRKVAPADNGTGGYATSTTDYPAKAVVEALSDEARAASGLPLPAVRISLLRAGMLADADLDDLVAVAGQSFRITRVDTDPAGVAWSLVAVPA